MEKNKLIKYEEKEIEKVSNAIAITNKLWALNYPPDKHYCLSFKEHGVTDTCKSALYNMNMRLNNGGTLFETEWNEFCGFSIYYSPELREVEFIKKKILNQAGSIKKEVRFYELIAKHANSDITEDEIKEYNSFLKNKKIQRFKILKDELQKYNIQSLEQFELEYRNIYLEVYNYAVIFQNEVLTLNKLPIPVYWDFKSYVHIFLRHCNELHPDGYLKSKSKYSSSYILQSAKEIRQNLRNAVQKLEDPIQDKLSKGLDFTTCGEKMLYFNRYYYSMYIESNGRVNSFHPDIIK